jgi:hypothetical protein
MPASRETPETLTVADLTFALRRSARRRTIGITIPREGLPVVALPARCSRRAAEAAVRGKLAWVRRGGGGGGPGPPPPPSSYLTVMAALPETLWRLPARSRAMTV